MTEEQYDKLTPEEQRVKIAELCGFVKNPKSWEREGLYHTWWNKKGEEPEQEYHNWQLPDYLNDLNDCHEFEKTLTGIAFYHYYAVLAQICLDEGDVGHVVSAPAAQRCKAFVLTLTEDQ